LIFGNHPLPYGGVPRHVKSLAGFLAHRGWTVHVLSMAGERRGSEKACGYTIHRPDRRERFEALARLIAHNPGFVPRQASRFSGLASRSPRLFLGCLGLAAACWEIARQDNLRLISAYHLVAAGLAGAWAADLLGIPLVTTVFGEIYAAPDFYRRHLSEVRYVVERSAMLLSCSHHCSRSFEVLGLSVPVRTVHYGVDTSEFSPAVNADPIRKRHGLRAGDHVVLFVGRMVREMGLHVLLAALPRLLRDDPSIKVMILGGSGQLRGEAEGHAVRYPGRVFVLADVPQSELPLYYAAATIAVSPSVNERACLGLAVAEAMASARPVVVTNIGGGPELVEHDRSGVLIPPSDPGALAEAVLGLAGDDQRCRRLGESGVAVARRGFDEAATNRRMEELFREAQG
jgi:glycosyltransferase involved in cell wall biosynthesis